MIDRIQRLSLREVWKHEAYDFTRWLCDNLDVINEVTGLTLESADSERAAGDFRIDLVAEDANGNTVVIENQLERSDHDHLGKLVTYVSNLGATAAIWLVSEPRPEHTTAVTWLNQTGAAAFYLVKAEAIRIADSAPAPLLTVIARPSEEGLQIGKTRKEKGERHALRKQYWTALLAMAKGRTSVFGSVSPGDSSYLSAGAGRSGLTYVFAIRQHDGDVQLYIDRGKESGEQNLRIFRELQQQRDPVEATYGGPLNWQELESNRACVVSTSRLAGGYRDDPSTWPEAQARMVETMVCFERAFRPHIAKLAL